MSRLIQARVCAKCRHEQTRELPPELAAFSQRSQWNTTCPKCGSAEYEAISFPRPTLTAELLNEWATNRNLSFSGQDEDLWLATEAYVPLLTAFVRRRDITDSKRATLLSALCVIIFENTFDPSEPHAEINTVLAIRVIQFLKDNLQLFDEIDTDYLYRYIMKDVYPQLGIERGAST